MKADRGQVGRRRSIVVLDYDPSWPAQFNEIKVKLEGLLDGLVQEICHIGSTSVPGLCAKPKIDVDVVLEAEELIPLGIERLTQAGYTFHGNKYDDGMWAFTTGRGSFGERVYLCAPGTPTHQKRLFFRDHLRANPDDAAEYGALKMRLASKTESDWHYYTGSKGPFVAAIITRAASASIQAVHVDKERIAEDVLADAGSYAFPTATTTEYAKEVARFSMFACLAPDRTPVGFLTLRHISACAAEVHVIAVKLGWHQMGVEGALLAAARKTCRRAGSVIMA